MHDECGSRGISNKMHQALGVARWKTNKEERPHECAKKHNELRELSQQSEEERLKRDFEQMNLHYEIRLWPKFRLRFCVISRGSETFKTSEEIFFLNNCVAVLEKYIFFFFSYPKYL